jgi:hypothetical protein
MNNKGAMPKTLVDYAFERYSRLWSCMLSSDAQDFGRACTFFFENKKNQNK